MISMYLLGNPDHYTGHKFVLFYWQPFIHEAHHDFTESNSESAAPQRVTIIKKKGRIVGLSPVHDLVNVGQYCAWHEQVLFFSNINCNFNLSICLEYKLLVQHFHYLNKIYLGTILCLTSLHTSLSAAGSYHHGTIFDPFV